MAKKAYKQCDPLNPRITACPGTGRAVSCEVPVVDGVQLLARPANTFSLTSMSCGCTRGGRGLDKTVTDLSTVAFKYLPTGSSSIQLVEAYSAPFDWTWEDGSLRWVAVIDAKINPNWGSAGSRSLGCEVQDVASGDDAFFQDSCPQWGPPDQFGNTQAPPGGWPLQGTCLSEFARVPAAPELVFGQYTFRLRRDGVALPADDVEARLLFAHQDTIARVRVDVDYTSTGLIGAAYGVGPNPDPNGNPEVYVGLCRDTYALSVSEHRTITPYDGFPTEERVDDNFYWDGDPVIRPELPVWTSAKEGSSVGPPCSDWTNPWDPDHPPCDDTGGFNPLTRVWTNTNRAYQIWILPIAEGP